MMKMDREKKEWVRNQLYSCLIYFDVYLQRLINGTFKIYINNIPLINHVPNNGIKSEGKIKKWKRCFPSIKSNQTTFNKGE